MWLRKEPRFTGVSFNLGFSSPPDPGVRAPNSATESQRPLTLRHVKFSCQQFFAGYPNKFQEWYP